jgi:hypothetical protein
MDVKWNSLTIAALWADETLFFLLLVLAKRTSLCNPDPCQHNFANAGCWAYGCVVDGVFFTEIFAKIFAEIKVQATLTACTFNEFKVYVIHCVLGEVGNTGDGSLPVKARKLRSWGPCRSNVVKPGVVESMSGFDLQSRKDLVCPVCRMRIAVGIVRVFVTAIILAIDISSINF